MDFHTLVETSAINILAALLGLSLPLLMQIIEKLDSRYGSGVISSAFREESLYKAYYVCVWLSIFSVLYLPIAPAPCKGFQSSWIVCNSAHLITYLLLTSTLILLITVSRLIAIYENPERLLKRLTADSDESSDSANDVKLNRMIHDDSQFAKFGALMKCSMTLGNVQLFLNCNSVLGGCIGLCRKYAGKGNPVVYSKGIYTLLNEAVRLCIREYDRMLIPTLNNPQMFLSAFFDEHGGTIISRDSLSYLWSNLSQIHISGKSEWLKGYWVWAAQYADYTIARRSEIPFKYSDQRHSILDKALLDSSDGNDREDLEILQKYIVESGMIREFHHVFSAYMMFVGNMEFVRWTFTYSPSSLETKLLIPKNIDEIVNELISISLRPMDIEGIYNFNYENGIKTGELMKKWLVRYYIAVLIDKCIQYRESRIRQNPIIFDYSRFDINPVDILSFPIKST